MNIKKLTAILLSALLIAGAICPEAFAGDSFYASSKSNSSGVNTALKDQIEEVNSTSYKDDVIDLTKQNHTVGSRDRSATWNSKVFYTLEGYVKEAGYYNKRSCDLIRRNFVTTDGNDLKCDVYLNPDNERPNKIVALEYKNNGLEVSECYYTNSGKPNFVFRYNTDNYVSTYATPDKYGERWLFNNDSLITWRVINKEGTWNHVIGSNEAKRLKDSWAPDTIHLYDEMELEYQKNFDEAEKNILNFAYVVYEAITGESRTNPAESRVMLKGRVVDENGTPISGSDVQLFDPDFKQCYYNTKTDKDGIYILYVPCISAIYGILCSGNQNSCRVWNIVVDPDDSAVYSADAVLTNGKTASQTLTFEPAKGTAASVAGGTVNVREGIDNYNGKIILTEDYGKDLTVVLKLPAGAYTLEVKAKDCQTVYMNVTVGGSNAPKEIICPIIPQVEKGHYCVLAEWADSGLTADAHLFTENDGEFSHQACLYGGSGLYTITDIDDGSYYKYCIVDRNNASNSSSTRMSLSCLRIYIFSNSGLEMVLYVPVGEEGVLWEAFELVGGVIKPVQRYYKWLDEADWWTDGADRKPQGDMHGYEELILAYISFLSGEKSYKGTVLERMDAVQPFHMWAPEEIVSDEQGYYTVKGTRADYFKEETGVYGKIYCAFEDLNGDGREECIFTTDGTDQYGEIHQIWTIDNNKNIVPVCQSWHRNVFSIRSDGTIYQYAHGGSGNGENIFYELNTDGSLVETGSFGWWSNMSNPDNKPTYYLDGNEITEEEADKMQKFLSEQLPLDWHPIDDFLTSGDSETSAADILPKLPEKFVFTSGAGAWDDVLELTQDGTFSGEYSDWDSGTEEDDYPNGFMHICNYSGQFENIKKLNDYSYSLELQTIGVEHSEGEEWVQDDMLYTASAPYGIYGTKFTLYLPQTPKSAYPAAFEKWYYGYHAESAPGDVLGEYALVNEDGGYVFWGK